MARCDQMLMTAVLAAGLTAPAVAQSLRFTPKDKEPVEVTADNGLELQQDTKRVIARGNAKAVQGDVSVDADELIADYRTRADGGNEVYRVFASGNVTMKSANETATGQTAVYDFDKAVLVLEGDHVNLVSADGQVSAKQALQYWSNEGVAVAEGDAFAQDKDKHKLYADKLIAFFRDTQQPAAPGKPKQPASREKGDINYVQGFGNVRMETPNEVVRGDRGAYNIDAGMATIDGAVKVTQHNSQLNGGYALINVKGGTSRLFASAAQAGQPGLKENARVRALLAPSTKADAGNGAAQQ